MLASATQDFVALVRGEGTDVSELKRTVQGLLQAARQSSAAERDDSLRTLAQLFTDGTQRTSPVALVCGALVEMGTDPSPVTGALLDRLPSLLYGAGALVDACLAEDDRPDPLAFEQRRKRKALLLPGPAAAWEALEQYWPFAIAVLSVSPESRVRAASLRPAASKIAPYHPGGAWIDQMLSVLHQAPIVVIEPRTLIGMFGRISGVANNFQLNVLLMGGFPGAEGLPQRVSQNALDVAHGRGPQKIQETVKGVWNLYTWRGLDPGFTLPDANKLESRTTWIRNESTPENIPALDGRRVILLGPPSYLRGWIASRTFPCLPASLDRERVLTRDEVEGWLRRMLDQK
ncbi:MAG: hypothetical protein WAL45_08605 [Terracidiphilus sp.]